MHVFFGIPIRGYPFKRRISPSLLVRFPFGIVEPQDSVEVVILRDRIKVLNSKYITLICKLFKDKSREHFFAEGYPSQVHINSICRIGAAQLPEHSQTTKSAWRPTFVQICCAPVRAASLGVHAQRLRPHP